MPSPEQTREPRTFEELAAAIRSEMQATGANGGEISPQLVAYRADFDQLAKKDPEGHAAYLAGLDRDAEAAHINYGQL